MTHTYTYLNRFITKDFENIDKKLDKQINREVREQQRKEYIDKTIQKILNIFKKEK
jgi:hypothetical protein